MDPETEVRVTTEPTTEEEKEQRQIAEDKREERKKILKEKQKQRKKAEAEKSRKMFEAKEATKAEKRAADEKRRAESKRIADERRELKRKADEKRKAEEKQTADEACSRISELPGELQVCILHHLPLKQLQQLELPVPLLRLVLQAREPGGGHQLVKWSWLHRIQGHGDRAVLQELARRADLAPPCDVIKPSLYEHDCSPFCPWFAPEGGWEAFYNKNPEDHYVHGYYSDDDEEEWSGSVESVYSDEYDYGDYDDFPYGYYDAGGYGGYGGYMYGYDHHGHGYHSP